MEILSVRLRLVAIKINTTLHEKKLFNCELISLPEVARARQLRLSEKVHSRGVSFATIQFIQ